MGEVIKFPTKFVRDWLIVEKGFREMLDEAQVSLEMKNSICSTMKSYWEKYDKEIPVTLPQLSNQDDMQNVTTAIDNLAEEFHKIMSQVMLDLFKIETELYMAKYGL